MFVVRARRGIPLRKQELITQRWGEANGLKDERGHLQNGSLECGAYLYTLCEVQMLKNASFFFLRMDR